MVGHGRPSAVGAIGFRPTRLAARGVCRCALALAIVVCSAAARGSEPALRVRVEWGGGTPRQWQGSISLSEGAVSAAHGLAVEADSPGAVWLAEGAVQIREPDVRPYDGVDLTLQAPLEATLVVELAAADGAAGSGPVEIKLLDLLKGHQSRDLDDQENQLLIDRCPGDRLRVSLDRKHLVFAPEENLELQVQPWLIDVPAAAKCSLELQLHGKSKKVWGRQLEFTAPDKPLEAAAQTPPQPFAAPLPAAEGVYDLTVTVSIRNRLRLKQVVAERTLQLIVLAEEPAAAAAEQAAAKSLAPKAIAEIDPAKPGWWKRLPKMPLLPAFGQGPWGNGDAQAISHPLGKVIELARREGSHDTSWEAYPLAVEMPGRPHILEVDYPTDVSQAMGISIVEPNAAGAVMPIGLDSGVYVTKDDIETPPRWAKHRLIFWPRTKSPVVLITARGESLRAVYGKLRLFSAGERLPRAFPAEQPAGRQAAAFLQKPLFPENFSAPEALDAASHRSLDDWNTFYLGGTRLVEYLQHVGQGGLMISVLADGSTIYPSALVEPTPRYDTGGFFSSGQDPLRKDVLEMLFRLFDRERLQLVPAIHFDAPLPALEALRREEAGAGVELVGADGKTWLARHGTRHGLAPWYNPLDPRVQQAMQDVVRELVERYRQHPSFGGVSLVLSSESYAQLPGAGWGCDPPTLLRFQKECGVRLPAAAAGRAPMEQLLAGPNRATWLEWRADELRKFYLGVQRIAEQARPGCRLYLAGCGLLDGDEILNEWRPALPRQTPVDRVLLDVGLAPLEKAAAERSPSDKARSPLLLLRPQRIAPPERFATQAVGLEFDESPELDRAFEAPGAAASVFYHPPLESLLPSFDAESPFAKSHTWLVSQLSPSGARNRRRFAHALAALDSQAMYDGGWLLPLGQEDALRQFLTIYRRLPAEKFQTVAGETQPVVIRTLSRNKRTFVYLVNDSPWRVVVDLRAQAAAPCEFHSLDESVPAPERGADGRQFDWNLTLEPYGLAAGWFSSADVRLIEPQVEVDDNVLEQLNVRIQELRDLADSLTAPQPYDVLANSGFEQRPDSGTVPGWQASGSPGESAALDAESRHEGEQSLRFACDGKRASLTSEPFEPPRTGRLSVSAWLRVDDVRQQPPLRLVLKGRLDGGEYVRYAALGGQRAAIGAEWRQYVFQLSDLPLTGLSPLRVQFDMRGPGEVWIDQVQLFDLVFSEKELTELNSRIIGLASAKLRQGQVGDCLRLLEGYWPRFLAAQAPPTAVAQKPSPRRPQKPSAAAPPQETQPAPAPSFVERVKSYLRWK